MQTPERPLGRRIWTGFVKLVGTLFVIALLVLVAFLASERNARTYSFSQTADRLVVMKGKMLPFGTEPWQPKDPSLADAYGPVPLDGTRLDEATLKRTFSDRDELDRALFGILESLARPRVQSDDPKTLERGVFYLRRAQLLSGISQAQRTTLEALQADVALYLARLKLDQARRTLMEALTQLQIAATGQNRNAQRANALAGQISGPARQFEDAVAQALGALPTPAPQTPEPAPEAPPAGPQQPQQPPQRPDASTPAPDASTAP